MGNTKWLFPSVFLLVLMAGFSAAAELQASSSQLTLKGWNCDPAGGAEVYSSSVYIHNPHEQAMFVNISYYDFPTSEMVDGGKQCTIPPESGSYCEISFPVRLGGEGDGIATVNVELTGTANGAEATDTATIPFTIMHSMTSTENSTIDNIEAAEQALNEKSLEVGSLCSSGLCCGLQAVQNSLSDASGHLAQARTHIRYCEFSQAITKGASAQNEVRELSDSYSELAPRCRTSLQLYDQALENVSSVNRTLYARSACGVGVNASRELLNNASSQLYLAQKAIEQDRYSDADEYLVNSISLSSQALNASEACNQTGFLPPVVSNTSAGNAATGNGAASGGDDTLSRVVNTIGYVVLAAIIIVVGAAVYIAMGSKRGLGDYMPRMPFNLEKTPEAEPFSELDDYSKQRMIKHMPKEEPAELQIDHSKIDKEFEDWLSQTEKPKKPVRKKK